MSRSTKYCRCHEKWARGIRSAARAARNHHHVSKNDNTFTDETFDPFKTSSRFTKYCSCHEKWPPKAPLILTHACQRSSNVPKVSRLPRGWMPDVLHLSRKTRLKTSKCPGCPTPATRNGHSSKNEHSTLEKTRPSETSKTGRSLYASLCRTFTREFTVKKPGARWCTLI